MELFRCVNVGGGSRGVPWVPPFLPFCAPASYTRTSAVKNVLDSGTPPFDPPLIRAHCYNAHLLSLMLSLSPRNFIQGLVMVNGCMMVAKFCLALTMNGVFLFLLPVWNMAVTLTDTGTRFLTHAHSHTHTHCTF